MALTTALSTKELERVATAAYSTKTLKVMLCNIGTNAFTENSTVANWQTVELSGNGYARASAVIGAATYSTANSRTEIPAIDAVFTATGTGFSYDRVVLYIDGETYPHSVLTEDPNIVLLAGQSQTYRLRLITDN